MIMESLAYPKSAGWVGHPGHLNTCLPSGSWDTRCHPQRLPLWAAPSKTSGMESLMSSLVDSILQVLSQLVVGEVSTSYASPLAEDIWKIASGPQTFIAYFFSLCWLRSASFSVINHSSDHDQTWTSVSLPSESSNLVVILRIPNPG